MSDTEQFVTIPVFLRGKFRMVHSPDEAPRAPSEIASTSGNREQFLANSHLPETLTTFLYHMDVKLDAIITALHKESLAQDFELDMQISRLSAGGLQLTTSVPLVPGDYIEVFFQIAHPHLCIASGVGTIKAHRRTAHGAEFDFVFTRIAEEEREKIIRFVFYEERKALRTKNLA